MPRETLADLLSVPWDENKHGPLANFQRQLDIASARRREAAERSREAEQRRRGTPLRLR